MTIGLRILTTPEMLPGYCALSEAGEAIWMGRLSEIPEATTATAITLHPRDYQLLLQQMRSQG